MEFPIGKGMVPLGYELKDGKLSIIEEETK
jgi:hypothetical protein